ncbi:PIN domain-containing protein [Humitalea rosea]|uniref:hypothetical protein n=1 Tax=Humitalea rosea TaxID=990373 RepID=UPI001B884715|nr:hypothetical protein [Humitalea rosea]
MACAACPALTLAEIRRGILEKEPGRRRRDLDAWFAGPEGPRGLFAGRILAFDEKAAQRARHGGGRDGGRAWAGGDNRE